MSNPMAGEHDATTTVGKLAQANKLPGQKIGKRWRLHKDAVDAWVKHGLSPERAGADE